MAGSIPRLWWRTFPECLLPVSGEERNRLQWHHLLLQQKGVLFVNLNLCLWRKWTGIACLCTYLRVLQMLWGEMKPSGTVLEHLRTLQPCFVSFNGFQLKAKHLQVPASTHFQACRIWFTEKLTESMITKEKKIGSWQGIIMCYGPQIKI